MPAKIETVEEARATLYVTDTFRSATHEIRLLFLLPESLWRPLDVSWWKGKQVCIIGGDEKGNYFLRHSDGSVRLWDHARSAEEVMAPSVRAFLNSLQPSGR